MQQVTKTAREITKKPEERTLADSDKEDEEDSSDDEDIIGPLPPPMLGKHFACLVLVLTSLLFSSFLQL